MSNVKIYQFGGTSPAPWYRVGGINQMVGYAIVTGNGKIILIDGGYDDDAAYLLRYLKYLAGGKPTISAWFFTHLHGDHTDAFAEIVKNRFDEIEIENIYYSFPEREEMADFGASFDTYDRFFENFDCFAEVAHEVEVGDVITVDDVSFEVLFTPKARYSASKNVNNSSLVIRMDACGQSVMFLADLAEPAGADFIKETSPEKLKSDIVQMAHHGQCGVNRNVYEAIGAKCCLWNAPDWLWENDAGKGYNTHGFQTIIVRKWMQEMGVKHHLVAKNGTQVLTLPADFNDFSWGQEEEA